MLPICKSTHGLLGTDDRSSFNTLRSKKIKAVSQLQRSSEAEIPQGASFHDASGLGIQSSVVSHRSWLIWIWEPHKLEALERDFARHLFGSLAILLSLAEGVRNAIMLIIGSSVGYKTAMFDVC
jgi:hypothetical protein